MGVNYTGMGARRNGKGPLAPPFSSGIKKMTSSSPVLQNTLKFSLAPTALAGCNLIFDLKRRKNAINFVCVFGAPKKLSTI